MARPWPKRALWPRRGKRGRKSYTVGFYDHDKRERCKTFPSVRHARAWMDDYVTAERRGRDSLRRFLLDVPRGSDDTLRTRPERRRPRRNPANACKSRQKQVSFRRVRT